jgi:hypothetical protein
LFFLRDIVGGFGLDSSGSDYGPVAGSCENGNETPDSTKGRKFRDLLIMLLTSQGVCCVELVTVNKSLKLLPHNISEYYTTTIVGLLFRSHLTSLQGRHVGIICGRTLKVHKLCDFE